MKGSEFYNTFGIILRVHVSCFTHKKCQKLESQWKQFICTYFLKFTYILGFWILKSALNVVLVCIFDYLRYLFWNACCQVVRMDVIINMHQFFVLIVFIKFILFCQFKKASALIFLLSIILISTVKEVFQWDGYRKELSSGLFWHSSLPVILAAEFAEYEPRPRTVNSAMKADIVREKKKPGIMTLYPEGIAILQD